MDIKSLIDKFMNGTSSLEEEQMLGSYFRTEKHLPKELKPYRKMFAYFDGGMTDRDLLRGGAESPDDKPFCMEATVAPKRQNKKTLSWRRLLAVAASVAVLLVVAFRLTRTEEERPHATTAFTQTIAQTVAPDTLNAPVDTLKTVEERQDKVKPIRRTPYKYRYQLAPPEVLTAEAQPEVNVDSINNVARQLAEIEVKKVELEQQYMLNVMKAINMLNAADIAEMADEEVF